MASNLFSQRQRAALGDLIELAAARARAEKETEEEFTSQSQAAQREFQEAQRAILSRFAAQIALAQKEHHDTTQAVTQRFKQRHGPLHMEFVNVKQKSEDDFGQEREQI